MVKKSLKVLGIIIGLVVVVATGYYLKAFISVNTRMNKEYSLNLQKLIIEPDSAMLALGRRLVVAKGCTDCHGEDLGGKVFIDDSALGLIVARNLTKGNGGLPPDHTVDDWVLALKHGVRRNMKPLLVMPSHEYTLLTESDMKAIIAYTTQLPNIDRELPQSDVGFLARILTDLGKLPLLPAEMIDHERTLVKEMKTEVSIDFGKYLASACTGCHRENMRGGEPIAPGFPHVADISSSGNPGHWTEDQFLQTLRTGETPEGKKLNPKDMPWTMTKAYTDTELKAIYTYLRSI